MSAFLWLLSHGVRHIQLHPFSSNSPSNTGEELVHQNDKHVRQKLGNEAVLWEHKAGGRSDEIWSTGKASERKQYLRWELTSLIIEQRADISHYNQTLAR